MNLKIFFIIKKNTPIRHNPYGPAVIAHNGTKKYYINGSLNRLDGPAIIFADGTKEWYIDGQLHRFDGPARIYNDGEKEWYLNDELVSDNQKDFYAFIKKIITSRNWHYLNYSNFKYDRPNPKDKSIILNIKNSLSHGLNTDSINILKSLL